MKLNTDTESSTQNTNLSQLFCAMAAAAFVCVLALGAAAQTATKPAAASVAKAKTFSTPQAAADALIDAAEKFDVAAIEEILGPEARDIINSGEPAQDRERATEFAKQARQK